LDCHGNPACSSFTIENLLTPFFEKTEFVVEFPTEDFSDYNCLNLKGSLKFYNEMGQEESILDSGGEKFTKFKDKHLCVFHVNISEVKDLPKYPQIKDLIAIWD
jgi:hypothetical protein